MIRRRVCQNLALAVCSTLTLSGCSSPFSAGKSTEQSFQTNLAQAIARELEAIPDAQASPRSTTQPASDVLETLAGRREELERIGPLAVDAQPVLELGTDLAGEPQQRVGVSLEEAIASAVARNLGIQASRLEPAISAEDLIEAQAVFDAVLFSNVDLSKLDQPQRVPVINGIPLGTPFSASETYRFETGLRQRFFTGGEAFVSTDLTRFQNNSRGIRFSPDPAYTAAVNLGLTQPLLRGFGDDVNRANIRLARNQEKRSIQQVRADLLQLAADTEGAYWDLVFAWRELAINEWLVEVGVKVREVLKGRAELQLDTTLAQVSDAVARVEQRKADVIRARRQVRAASDALKRLINDPELTVSSEAVLYPSDEVIESPISYSWREAILTAIERRPEIEQAALAIDDARIRQRVADNSRLPLLDLSAQMSFAGLDDNPSDAYHEIGETNFIDYILGLTFEYPLGNRGAEAAARRARLLRTSAALNYRRAVQDVILDVKAALRDVITNYELILATRSFRVAQAENLRALLVEEDLLASLTPEFLNLKFTRQETLAEARRQEVQALVNFDKSLAALYRAMGIGLTMKNIEVEMEGPAP